MTLTTCYFCGFADDTALSEHHIIPKQVDSNGDHDDDTVVLCRNCHKKVHDLIDPLIDHLSRETEGTSAETEQPDRVAAVINSVESVRKSRTGRPDGALIEDVVTELEERDVDDAVQAVVEAKMAGVVYTPRDGFLRTA